MAWVASKSLGGSALESDLHLLRYECIDPQVSPLDCWAWDVFALYKLAHICYESPTLKASITDELIQALKQRRSIDPHFPDMYSIEAIWIFNSQPKLRT